MNRYHCPYCSPSYQFYKQRSDGIMVCGQCGDPLVKVPLIKVSQILALITASAFVAPFLIAVVLFLNDLYKEI